MKYKNEYTNENNFNKIISLVLVLNILLDLKN